MFFQVLPALFVNAKSTDHTSLLNELGGMRAHVDLNSHYVGAKLSCSKNALEHLERVEHGSEHSKSVKDSRVTVASSQSALQSYSVKRSKRSSSDVPSVMSDQYKRACVVRCHSVSYSVGGSERSPLVELLARSGLSWSCLSLSLRQLISSD